MADKIDMCANCHMRRCQLGSNWCLRCEKYYEPSLKSQDRYINSEVKKLCFICLNKFPEQNKDVCPYCVCSLDSPLAGFTAKFPICVQCRTTIANPGYSLCEICHQAEIATVTIFTPNDTPKSVKIDQVSKLVEVPKRLIPSTSNEPDSDIFHCLCPFCYEDWDSPSDRIYCVSCFEAVIRGDNICNLCRVKLLL